MLWSKWIDIDQYTLCCPVQAEQVDEGLLKTPPQSPEDISAHSSSDSDDLALLSASQDCSRSNFCNNVDELPTEEIERVFDGCDGELDVARIAALLSLHFQLPRACGQLVFNCLMRSDDREPSGTVSRDSVLEFCVSHLASRDLDRRFFNLITHYRRVIASKDSGDSQPSNRDQFGLTVKDIIPLIHTMITSHPSLKFLCDYRRYVKRFCEFIAARIVHALGFTMEMISLRDLRRSKLLDYLKEVEDTPDLDDVCTYSFFTLRYFQVVYNKYCFLTSSSDSNANNNSGADGRSKVKRVTRRGLLNYGNGSISEMFVDRVLCGYMRPLKHGQNGLDFEEFVWFVLCEEDKSKPLSVEALFRCADIDGDGKLSAKDLEPFYEHILDRCWQAGEEEFLFESPFPCVHRRLVELLQPENSFDISLRDFKKRDVADIFFSVLFDYRKFIILESKETWIAADAQPMDDNARCLYRNWSTFSGFEKYAIWCLEAEKERWLNGQMAATV